MVRAYIATVLTSNVAVFAAETSSGGKGSSFDLVTPFLNVGLVGVLLLMFVFRKGIVPEWVLRSAEERHKLEIDAKDKDIAELKLMVKDGNELYNTQVVPAFTRSIDVNKEYLEYLREAAPPQRPAARRAPRPRGE